MIKLDMSEREYTGDIHSTKNHKDRCVCGCISRISRTILENILSPFYQTDINNIYDEPITKKERDMICKIFQSDGYDIMISPNFWKNIHDSRLSVFKYLIDMKFLDMSNDVHRKRLRDVFVRDTLMDTWDCNYDGMEQRTRKFIEYVTQTFIDYGYITELLETFQTKFYHDDKESIEVNALMSLLHQACYPEQNTLKQYLELYRKYNVEIKMPFYPKAVEDKVKIVLKNEKYPYGYYVMDVLLGYIICSLDSDYVESTEFVQSILDAKYFELNLYHCTTHYKRTHIEIYSPIQYLLYQFSLYKDPRVIQVVADFLEKLIKMGLDPTMQGFDVRLINDKIETTTVTVMDYAKYYGWIYPDSPVKIVLDKYCPPDVTTFEFEKDEDEDDDFVEKLMRDNKYVKDPEQLKELTNVIEGITRKDLLKKFDRDIWKKAPYVGDIIIAGLK